MKKKEPVRLVPPAPPGDVQREQFEYLMNHGSPNCPKGCEDCQRAEDLRRVLMKPFDLLDRAMTAGSVFYP